MQLNHLLDAVTAGTGYKDETGLGTKNSSTQNPNEGSSKDTGTAPDESNKKLPVIGESIRYPEDLNAKQDYILFKAVVEGTSVALPIQASITDQNTVQWGGDSLNTIELLAAEASIEAMSIKDEESLKKFGRKYIEENIFCWCRVGEKRYSNISCRTSYWKSKSFIKIWWKNNKSQS